MRNWLGYAKKIGDLSYKNIIDDITILSLIEKMLSIYILILHGRQQLKNRKKKSPKTLGNINYF